MPKNKQTWDNSKQLVADVKWSKNNHENALLNTGVPLEENDWVRPGIPVRWITDSSFKSKKKTTLLTYSFMTTRSKLNYGDERQEIIKPYANFSRKQQKDIGKLFKTLSSYANINFKKVPDKKTVGTIRIGFNTITDEAGQWLPGIGATGDPPNPEPRGGDIWFNKNLIGDIFNTGLVNNTDSPTPSCIMLHEILHTLGLEHPDNPKKPTPEFARNREHTLMADDFSNSAGFTQYYKDNGETASAWEEVGVDSTGKQYGVSSTPMPWDIAGLQYLYGINKNTNKGNTIYTYSNTIPFYETIWDASGIDTIDLNNFGKDLTINLNGGELSTLSFDVADEHWSNKQHGNLGIAFEAVIENGTGGSGNDSIIGNSANNTLKGNSGNDNLFGKGGIDVLIGGEGHDIFKLQQGNGHAIIEDFISGSDQIVLEQTAEIKTINSSIGMEIYQNNDLIAIVKNYEGLLDQSGVNII
jgi:serralysin